MQTLVRLALTLVIASLAAAPVFAQPEPAHDASVALRSGRAEPCRRPHLAVKGYAIAFAPSITANWDAASGQQWTVPLGIGIGISRTTVFNRGPMTLGVQYLLQRRAAGRHRRADAAPQRLAALSDSEAL